MGDIKAYILQNERREILAVETNIKKLTDKHSQSHNLLSYQHLQREIKKAKDNGKSTLTFKGKEGEQYKISWWNLSR